LKRVNKGNAKCLAVVVNSPGTKFKYFFKAEVPCKVN